MENKKEFLKILGFEEKSNNFYEKYYYKHNYKISVNLKNNKVYYRDDDTTIEGEKVKPDGKILIGEKTSSNLNQPESFVVLEAVNRLLEKGYSPSHIHLEKKWKLGRSAKSGRADIVVYERELDDEGYLKPLMIIECKTWGKEFEKEKQRLKQNGGQLFSYLQQERNAKYLVLYTSDLFENEEDYFIDYDNIIIKVIDDEKKVKECKEKNKKKKIKKPCSFKETSNKEELFEVWKRVYRSFWYKHGIFNEEVPAYDIELKPLKKRDLIELKNPQGLFNKFAEILRHNNISDNANAFNKMLNLMLCKIVDEEEKSDNDELDFQVKGGEEYEKLVDRLQKLYFKGMTKHLNIYDFVYYSDEDIEKYIRLYPKETPLEEILRIFKEVKYYTNNEFAFKEVHNKKLFDENAEILIEVIELLQPYKFKHSHKHQFLGDFFELLLDFGVKQSEGQFFTPMPIVNFINGSLKIEDIINLKLQNEKFSNKPIPKFLDYACGAGHFITDIIDKINNEIEKNPALKDYIQKNWEKESIYGIEKDYRLARTSKLACFLAGDGDANIIYGDGLDEHKELNLDVEKIDIISTNPPYSVRNFKKYLDVKVDYSLLSYLTENSKEIEVLFIERAKQILKEDIGRIGIILPSSILSNSGIYEKAREILLKHFEIKAIVELGSNAFIATGTNTIVLFLKRRDDNFLIDRKRVANRIFSGEYFKNEIYDRSYLIYKKFFEMFINYRGFKKEDYYKFILEDTLSESLSNTDIFKDYKSAFEKEAKKIKKTSEYKNKSKEEQTKYLNEKFIQKTKEIEKEKFFFFLLTFYNGKKHNDEKFYEFQNVFVVKAPEKTEKQKEFLGYEFSKRRGYEGIVLYKDENGEPTTKLYDEKNYDNPKKISAYIRSSFNDKILEVDDEIKPFGNWYKLPDLIDFEKITFDKAINLMPKKTQFINSKWEMVRLGDVAEIEKGENITKKEIEKGDIPVVAGGKTPAYFHNKSNREGEIITVSASGANAGYVNYWENPIFASDCSTIKGKENKILTKYIYYFLKAYQDYLYLFQKGTAQPHVYPQDLKSIKIPLPPIEIQKELVDKIQNLEKEEKENLEKIKELENEIEKEINSILSKKWEMVKLKDVTTIENGGTPKTTIKEYWNGNIPWITLEDIKGKYIYETKRKITELGLKNSNAKLLPIDTVVFSSRATIGKTAISKIPLATNQGFKNFICKKDKILPEFLYYILKKESKNIENLSSGTTYKEISKSKLENYKISLPPLKIQQQLVEKIEKIEEKIKSLKEKNKQIQKEIKKIIKETLE